MSESISHETETNVFGSALAKARPIHDLRAVLYPEGVEPPKDLEDAAVGKLKYDRGFLMQFMTVCKGKPANLAPVESLGLDPAHPLLHVSSKPKKELRDRRGRGFAR